MKGYWYLATPYSKYPTGHQPAFEMACKVAGRLIKHGFKLFCPIAHTHPISHHGRIDSFSPEQWIALDRPMMDAAFGLIVVRAPSWESSWGIGKEIEVFTQQNKPIMYIDLLDGEE